MVTEPDNRTRSSSCPTQMLQDIDRLFRDDQEAQMLHRTWQERYDPVGVRELWSLSQNEYNTIVRRIRRHSMRQI